MGLKPFKAFKGFRIDSAIEDTFVCLWLRPFFPIGLDLNAFPNKGNKSKIINKSKCEETTLRRAGKDLLAHTLRVERQLGASVVSSERCLRPPDLPSQRAAQLQPRAPAVVAAVAGSAA